MVNSNPETVSTDYDTSARLYFEPLSTEDVLAVCEAERPIGVDLSARRADAAPARARPRGRGLPRCSGRRPSAIDLAEDRGKFAALLRELEIAAPPHGEARDLERGARGRRPGSATRSSCAPRTCSAGRAMEIVYARGRARAVRRPRPPRPSPDHPVLIDRFLEGAIEIDVDAVCDGTDVFVGAVMEHIEEAGVHSGDSSCQIPPATLSEEELDEIEAHHRGAIARRLRRRRADQPAARGQGRAHLGARGEPPRLADRAVRVEGGRGAAREDRDARCCSARTLPELEEDGVLPADPTPLPPPAVHGGEGRRPAVRSVPGRRHDPRPRDAIDRRGDGHRRGARVAPSRRPWWRAGPALPARGDRRSSRWPTATSARSSLPAKRLAELGFRLLATRGTAGVLERAGIPVTRVAKVSEGGVAVAWSDLIRARRGRPRDQHAVRARPADRRLLHPDRGGPGRHPVHHDGAGRARGGPRDRGPARRARDAGGRSRSTTSTRSRPRPGAGAARGPRRAAVG